MRQSVHQGEIPNVQILGYPAQIINAGAAHGLRDVGTNVLGRVLVSSRRSETLGAPVTGARRTGEMVGTGSATTRLTLQSIVGTVQHVQIAAVVLLFVAGGAAHYHRWLWGVIVTVALGIAVWNWTRGAYSNSGNAIGFSILIVVVVAALAPTGAVAGSLARAVEERRHRERAVQRLP